MSTTSAERLRAPWGAIACGLGPRAAGDGLADLDAEGLVRVSFAFDGAPRPDVEQLLSEAASVRRDGQGRVRVLIPRARLEELARATPWVEHLLNAFDLAAAPAPPPRLVGVLNATPDSFSDGGELPTVDSAVERAHELKAAGAEILDVGGESTRPGALPVTPDEERRRVVPVIEALVAEGLGPVSVDTRRAAVAEAAIRAGAQMVNDVEAGTRDAQMLPVVAVHGVEYVAMHMRGEPTTMQAAPHYQDVVDEVAEFLRSRVGACVAAGIDPERIVLDPGIGFGKALAHNLTLLARLAELRSIGLPLYLGVSRKRFIGALTEEAVPARRLHGTAAAVAACIGGGAEFLRVHDVAEMRAVARVAAAVRDAGGGERDEC
ncbi:MAG: dihydropteroate synthase [Planctomycetota bacterium]